MRTRAFEPARAQTRLKRDSTRTQNGLKSDSKMTQNGLKRNSIGKMLKNTRKGVKRDSKTTEKGLKEDSKKTRRKTSVWEGVSSYWKTKHHQLVQPVTTCQITSSRTLGSPLPIRFFSRSTNTWRPRWAHHSGCFFAHFACKRSLLRLLL